jgi:hypothetical protein
MIKKDYVKKTKKADVVTRFWYTLKNLHPNGLVNQSIFLHHIGLYVFPFISQTLTQVGAMAIEFTLTIKVDKGHFHNYFTL